MLNLLILFVKCNFLLDGYEGGGDPNKKQNICKGPNSKIDINGNCVCRKAFPFGDPTSEEGCYGCSISCHHNAECVKQDVCVCKKNYIGDGVNDCSRPMIKIKKYYPDRCDDESNKIYFDIEKSVNFVPDEVFCRFGSYVSEGTMINSTMVRCMCPDLRSGIVIGGVSYDKEQWSLPKALIEFQQQENDDQFFFSLFFFLMLLILALIYVLSLIWLRHRTGQFRSDSEEVLPLNKWHMYQIQQDVGEENSIIDFIQHIITS